MVWCRKIQPNKANNPIKLKKGYRKTSLKVHPDRVDDEHKEVATEKFQTLGKVYVILSDKEKRAVYDESGEVDDEDDMLQQDRDWYDYWRILFRPVSKEDIKDFEEKYKGSEEELEDLKEMYCEYEGDMDLILEGVMCATVDDQPRFTQILKDLIKKKEIPKFPKFTQTTSRAGTSARKRKAEKEAVEAEELSKELGLGQSTASLQALIQSRQQSRSQKMDSFFSDLEAKYAEPKKSKSATGSRKSKKK